MASNGSICQGFVYDSFTNTAFFKGSPPKTQLDPSKLCLHPNNTAWLLNTGVPELASTFGKAPAGLAPVLRRRGAVSVFVHAA